MNGLSQLDADFKDPTIVESIRDGRYDPLPLPAPNDKPLNEMGTISYFWPGPLPNFRIHVFVGIPTKMSPADYATEHGNDLASMVTLSTKSRMVFERPGTVEKNSIHELDGTAPDFLTEFRIKLEQRRWIEPGVEVCFFT
jgi:hypothetical protein